MANEDDENEQSEAQANNNSMAVGRDIAISGNQNSKIHIGNIIYTTPPEQIKSDANETIETEEWEPKTILIPAGTFWMGSDAGEGIKPWEKPRHEVNLSAYRIGKYPVTNNQYEYFVRDTKSGVSDAMRWKGQVPPKGQGEQPVLGVTLIQAIRYCEWLSKVTKRTYSLPNEAQWEKACRGSYEGMSFTGSFLEWTCSLWGKVRNKFDPTYDYPWKNDGRNDLKANFQIRRVMRGGIPGDEVNPRRYSARSGRSSDDPGTADMPHGFRVVLVF